jgi:urease accessory protein
MITATRILGNASEPSIAERLHQLEHRDQLEILVIDRENALRHRLRGRTDKGTDIAIALGRDEKLTHGTVMLLEADRAIVVHMTEESWLRLVPRDADAALEVGYSAGNHHWRVRFVPGALLVAVQGPVDHYLARLSELTKDGRIEVAGHE